MKRISILSLTTLLIGLFVLELAPSTAAGFTLVETAQSVALKGQHKVFFQKFFCDEGDAVREREVWRSLKFDVSKLAIVPLLNPVGFYLTGYIIIQRGLQDQLTSVTVPPYCCQSPCSSAIGTSTTDAGGR